MLQPLFQQPQRSEQQPQLLESGQGEWSDPFRGRRGHALMTKAEMAKIPGIMETEVLDETEKVCHVKLFTPYSNFTWYVIEMDKETGECFGLSDGGFAELGYFDLNHLARLSHPFAMAVERDRSWQPKSLSDVRKAL